MSQLISTDSKESTPPKSREYKKSFTYVPPPFQGSMTEQSQSESQMNAIASNPVHGLKRKFSILDSRVQRNGSQLFDPIEALSSSSLEVQSKKNYATSSKIIESRATNLFAAQQEMYFDSKLKAKAQQKDFKNADERSRKRKTFVRGVLILCSFIFIFVTPTIQPSQWCLNGLRDDRGNLPHNGIFLDCGSVADKELIPYTGLPQSIPLFTSSLDIFCVSVFAAIKLVRLAQRKQSKYVWRREMIFGLLASISLIDSIVSLVMFDKQIISNLLRPVLVVLMFRSQQDFFYLVGLNIRDSIAMLICLLVWVLFFAFFAQFLFSNMMEGNIVFNRLADSYWNMFVCLTTENFPDVMLLATAKNSAYALFFIVFIVVGVFFLTNVLLAVIFDNFKSQMERLQRKKVSHRMEYIQQFFNAFDEQGNGWLTIKQAREFFSTVLDLDFKKCKHQRQFRKIMKVVDPEDNKFVLKERVLEFFQISGFQIIGQLCQEQMKLEKAETLKSSIE